jgi:hypothetical protein
MEHVVFKTAAEETWYIDKVIFLFVDRYVYGCCRSICLHVGYVLLLANYMLTHSDEEASRKNGATKNKAKENKKNVVNKKMKRQHHNSMDF